MFFAASWMNMLYPAMLKPSKTTLYSSVDISHVSSHSMIVTPNSNFCCFLMFDSGHRDQKVESGSRTSRNFLGRRIYTNSRCSMGKARVSLRFPLKPRPLKKHGESPEVPTGYLLWMLGDDPKWPHLAEGKLLESPVLRVLTSKWLEIPPTFHHNLDNHFSTCMC